MMASVIPVVSLPEKLAHPMDYLVETLHFPDALGGLVIALLVATPEALGAAKAALPQSSTTIDEYLSWLGSRDDRAHRTGDRLS